MQKGGRVHVWAKAGATPGWVSSPSRGPIWAIVGSVSSSRVPWQRSRGILVLSPTTRTTSMFCQHQVLNQEPSAQSPTDWATATLGNKQFYVNDTIAFIAFAGIRWNCLLLLCKTTWVLLSAYQWLSKFVKRAWMQERHLKGVFGW